MNYLSIEDLILKEDIRGILKFTNLQNSNQKISRKSLSKLNKIVSNSEHPINFYLCGLIYLVCLSQGELNKADDDLISVTTSNILFSIMEHIKGTRLANKLLPYLLLILDMISSKNPGQDYNMIENLVRENNNFYFSKILTEIDDDETFKAMVQLAKTEKLQAFNDYQTLINSCATLNEQMILFTEKSSQFFSNLLFAEPNHPSFSQIRFLHILTKFLDSIVYEYSYELDLDKELLQEEDESVCKTFDHKAPEGKRLLLMEKDKVTVEYKYEFLHELIQHSPNFCSSIYPLLNFLIENALVKKDQKSVLDSEEQQLKSEILKMIVSVINRIYFNFPFENERVMEKMLIVFREIDESLNFYEEAKVEGAKFLTRLIKNNEAANIEQFVKFASIYNRLKIPGDHHFASLTMSELSIKDGFPLNVNIDAGGAFEQIIEIWLPNSILHLAFATKWYDVNFQISYLGGFEEIDPKEVILMRCDKMNFEKNAYRLTLLMKKTGLYKISFDNYHSWFTEKQLRYRIFVLENIQSNLKYPFPFHSLMRNDEGIKGKAPIGGEEKQSKYFISDYKAVMLLDKKGLHFLASQPNKSYEMSIEIEQMNLAKFKERVINALKKTFSENLNDFFKNKLLSFAFVQTNTVFKFPEKEHGNEEVQAIPTFYSILEELKINLKESVIDGKEILIEMIKHQINFKKTMVNDNILIVFEENEELNVSLLNNLKINYADMIHVSDNEGIISFKKTFKTREKNKELVAFLCIYNALICLGVENIKSIIINKPGILEMEDVSEGIPHEVFFSKILKEKEHWDESFKNIDFTYLNICIKIDDLILL